MVSLANINEEEASYADNSFSDVADDKDKEQAEDLGNKIAKRETRAVGHLRAGLLFALISATLAVSLAVFYYTRNRQEQDFEDAFADNSLKIVESFQTVGERRLSAIASFGTTITSYAIGTNATWPFVTVPQFEARCSHLLNLAEAVAIAFAPIVEDKDRAKWEDEYVPNNIRWAEESFTYLETTQYASGEDTSAINDAASGGGSSEEGGGTSEPPPTYEGMPDFSSGYSKEIFTYGFTPLGGLGPLIVNDEGPYIPWWQRAPSSRSEGVGFVNIELRDDPSFNGNMLEVLQNKKAALGNMVVGEYGSVDGTVAAGPTSGFYYPILKDSIDGEDVPVVGTLATLVFWDRFFVNILPQNVVGVLAVIKNTCDQAYTFQINGPDSIFLGEGDLHDSAYDDMSQEVSFTSLIQAGIQAKTYLGFPMDDQGCQYTLKVYASSDMEDEYVTIMPYMYMVGSILIFLFTSLVFILYDRLVEHRQRLVLREAEKSGAIVSSLFPTAYKERLMQVEEEKLNKAKKMGRMQSVEAKGSLLSSFMRGEGFVENNLNDDEPIADLYQDCTVFFADVAVSAMTMSFATCIGDIEPKLTPLFVHIHRLQGFTQWR